MSTDDPDREDTTPLPPPSRQSELDMAHELPKLTLAAASGEKTGPRPKQPPIDEPEPAKPEPAKPEPPDAPPAPEPPADDDEPAAPHVIAPWSRPLVWCAIAAAAFAGLGIGSLFAYQALGAAIAMFAIAGGALVAGGYAATRYAWSANDLWLDAGAVVGREGALPLLGILTLGMMFLYAGVFGGETVGDDLSFHMAEARRIADCLSVGDFDLWNPSANAGFASAYYYQVVPQLASAIPAAIFGHFLFWFQLSIALPLVLAPAAAYRGMRLMGATPWQALFAAVAVGLMNGESRWGTGNAGTFQVGLYTQTWALAALPLAIGHAVRWMRDGVGLASAASWGTFVFLCHPFAGISLAFIVGIGLVANLIAGAFASLARASGEAWFVEHVGGMRRAGAPSSILPAFARAPMLRAATEHLARRWMDLPRATGPWYRPWLRAIVLGACLFVMWSPIYLPLLIDKAGFGGFPHRVADEVGPGFTTLWQWWKTGAVMDFGGKLPLFTWLFIPVFLFARGPMYRYLWWSALFFALLLGLGPHLGTTQNDLFPAVRFLGAMQIGLALGIGAGAHAIGAAIWRAREGSLTLWVCWLVLLLAVGLGGPILVYVFRDAPLDSWTVNLADILTLRKIDNASTFRLVGMCIYGGLTLALLPIVFFKVRSAYAIRTTLAALGAAAAVFVFAGHGGALRGRVHVLPEYERTRPGEMQQINAKFAELPQGRKQVGPGAENHWWNLLSYVYARRPALLQMGGGGLQASPNYDFLWNIMRQYDKNAYIYDAPYLLFQKASAATMPKGDLVFETASYEIRKIQSTLLVAPITITGELPGGDNGKDTPMRNAALAWIKSDAPMRDEHLAYPGSGPTGPKADGRTIRAWRQDSPGDDPDIVAEVEAKAPTTYVVRESWHPRWHAYVDGAEVPVKRVTPDFPAVDVPAGTHTIALRFERPWWAWGAWLAWPGIATLAWYVLRRRRAALPRARVV